MSDDKPNVENEEKLEQKLIDFVYDWAAYHAWNSEDEISSAIAITNSIFDETHIDDVCVDIIQDNQAEFSLNGTMSGYPRKDDVPWCGDTIHFSATGGLTYDEGFDKLEVSDFSVASAEVEEPKYEEYEEQTPSTLIPEFRCEGVDDLLSKMSQISNKLWCRGHGDEAWALKTSIARQDNPRLSLEIELRLAFENHSTFLAPASHPMGTAKINFLMQHHGLPTRLLDWSTSPLTALYFAVCDKSQDKSDACLWVLDPSQLNKIHTASFPHVCDDQQEAIFTEESERVLAIHAPYTDLRMKLQQSEFTLHADYRAIEDESGAELFLQEKIIIPGSLKPEIRACLESFGVTRSTLFPDMDNIAQAIKDDIL